MPTPTSFNLLKFLRLTHRYLGIFIAPMLLFFAITGAMQTLMLHEATPGSAYVPPKWIMTLAQIHKNQTSILAPKKQKLLADQSKGGAPAAAAPTAPAPSVGPPMPKVHLPEKIFFLLVSLGLFVSTLTGIYMAYKFERSAWLVSGLLVAGVVVPLVLLKF
jgi:hypothetical protein